MDKELLQKCKANNRAAQRKVYEMLYPKLHFTCRRYLKAEVEVEEAMADTFYIIFTQLSQLKELQAFDAWARRIAVNRCLAYLKKQTDFTTYLEDEVNEAALLQTDKDQLQAEDLMRFLDYIPAGCKTVFNLFAIEGFSHKEIAEQLGISVGTSKSQLNAAKSKLQQLVNQYY